MQPNNRSAYLIIRQGNRWTDIFRLENSHPLIIGRASSNEIPIADERASRRHAEVFFESGEWKVRDLGSRNGTLVDGKKIGTAWNLVPGNQILVAGCRLTFTHSLEDVAPPLDVEQAVEERSSHTQGDIAPAITHRQAKSAILDSSILGDLEKTLRTSAPTKSTSRPVGITQSPFAIELLQLAFELAKQASVSEACELALQRLLTMTGCQSGGILRLDVKEASNKKTETSITVLAAREQNGRAYHPVTPSIIESVEREASAILARNVSADNELVGNHDDEAASSWLPTTSIIAAPLRLNSKLFGLVHLYARKGEPELTADNLEIALAIADVLSVSIENLLKQQTLESKLSTSRNRISELEEQLGHGDWVSHSKSMEQVRLQVLRVAATQATILIRGESGTGKELVARAIHDNSPRVSGPFVAINCAALTPTLLESELFGHEKGAFTGATDRKIGKFELANHGTLMLDELGEMSMEIQSKFLRVLENRVFERVGGNKPIQVNVRVIAATNRDLEQAVKDGEFRSDLYFRLRVIELRIPPLRDRTEDIPLLAQHFLTQFRQRSGHGPLGFTDRAIDAMREYAWPGNVRELRNCVERAYVLATGPRADLEDLALSYLQVPGQDKSQATAPPAQYRERTLDDIEQEHIEATLKHTSGQKNRAATILGIERSTLDRKLKRFHG